MHSSVEAHNKAFLALESEGIPSTPTLTNHILNAGLQAPNLVNALIIVKPIIKEKEKIPLLLAANLFAQENAGTTSDMICGTLILLKEFEITLEENFSLIKTIASTPAPIRAAITTICQKAKISSIENYETDPAEIGKLLVEHRRAKLQLTKKAMKAIIYSAKQKLGSNTLLYLIEMDEIENEQTLRAFSSYLKSYPHPFFLQNGMVNTIRYYLESQPLSGYQSTRDKYIRRQGAVIVYTGGDADSACRDLKEAMLLTDEILWIVSQKSKYCYRIATTLIEFDKQFVHLKNKHDKLYEKIQRTIAWAGKESTAIYSFIKALLSSESMKLTHYMLAVINESFNKIEVCHAIKILLPYPHLLKKNEILDAIGNPHCQSPSMIAKAFIILEDEGLLTAINCKSIINAENNPKAVADALIYVHKKNLLKNTRPAITALLSETPSALFYHAPRPEEKSLSCAPVCLPRMQ